MHKLEPRDYNDNKITVYTVEYDNTTCGPWPKGTELFVSGCNFNCPDCTNKELQIKSSGREISIQGVADAITSYSSHKKVTFCGGEPMLQHESLNQLACTLKDAGYTILVYTGYTYPDVLLELPGCLELLKHIDILVDGLYLKDYPSDSTYYGSTNQRVIDMPETLAKKQIILYNKEER